MQHDEKQNELESLFNKWLVGDVLTHSELAKLRNDSQWHERMMVTERLQTDNAALTESLKVPEWNIDQTFSRHTSKQSWWNQNGFSALAMTFSIFACSVLAFDLKVHWTDSGLTVMTGQQQQQAWQQAQNERLQNQLDNWLLQSNEHISDTFAMLEQRQAEQSAKIASYLMESSRLERQEDLQRLAKAFQTQQAEDLQYIESEINRLQYRFRMASMGHTNEYDGAPVRGLSEE